MADQKPGAATSLRSAPAAPLGERLNLARLAAGGDVWATRRLLEMVAPRVVATVRAVMGPAHIDLEDAYQLALIGFVQALPEFRGECDPTNYAARIALRVATATRKRAIARRVRTEAIDPDDIELAHESIAAARRRSLVRSLIDRLPPEQGETLALRVVLGWSLREIASAMGTPVNTVRSRLRLAKEAVRKHVASVPGLAEALDGSEGGSDP